MSIIVKGSGGGSKAEDLTAVLSEQATLIQEIEESLVGKASGANITPETVLKGYRGYKGKNLVEGNYIPHGLYIWEKLTSKDGEFINYVVSDDVSTYPESGLQEGYWYEIIVSDDKKIPEYGVIFDSVNADGRPTKLSIKIPYEITLSGEYGGLADVVKYCEEITVEYNLQASGNAQCFEGLCANFAGKVKVKSNWLPRGMCHYMRHDGTIYIPDDKAKRAVWIAKTVETIKDGGSKYSSSNPFYGAKSTTIYCEANEKQPGWETYWNYAGTSSSETLVLTTYYGITEEQFDAL